MKNVRVKVAIVVMVTCAMFAGCISTQENIIKLTDTVGNLMTEVDNTQEIMKQLAVDGIVSSEKVDKVNENIDKIQSDVKAVAKSIEDNVQDPVKAAQAAIKASEPFNPYAKEMQLGLGLITIAAGWFANQKRKEKNDLNLAVEELASKYKAMKRGNEKFRIDNPDKANELYKNVGEERSRYGLT